MLEPFLSQLPPVTDREQEGYARYMELLGEWNERINLVSRKSFKNTVPAHLVDSIWISHHCERHREGRVIRDIGTGAGFPGIIYAIRYPEVPIHLYEKLEKRRKFLAEVIQQLGLRQITLRPAFPDGNYDGFFVARAVFPIPKWVAFCQRHIKGGGRFATMLGGGREPTGVPPSFRLLEQVRYSLPGDFGDRQVEIFERVPRGTQKGS